MTRLPAVMDNLDKTTTNLSNLDLEKTLTTLNGTIGDLKSTIGKLNSNTSVLQAYYLMTPNCTTTLLPQPIN